MKVLFNDILQNSNLPYELKTAALSECYRLAAGEHGFNVTLPQPKYIDSIGIGYTDGKFFKFSFTAHDGWIIDGKTSAFSLADYEYMFNGGGALQQFDDYGYLLDGSGNAPPYESFTETIPYSDNGLYLLEKPVVTQSFTILTDATYIGRIGAGRAVQLGTAMPKEPAYNNSAPPRVTLSGQVIQGAGGYSFRSVSLDTRYKIGSDEISEIKAAYTSQIGPALPFFLLFDDEIRRLPFSRLYASDKKNTAFAFESGVNRYLFSRRFDFEEQF
jgi:hypothetical protein